MELIVHKHVLGCFVVAMGFATTNDVVRSIYADSNQIRALGRHLLTKPTEKPDQVFPVKVVAKTRKRQSDAYHAFNS